MTRLLAGSSGVRVPIGAADFSLLQNLQTGSAAHPVSYSLGTGVLSRGVKRPGRYINHSSSSAEVKNKWSYTSTLLYMPSWLDRDSFTLTTLYNRVSQSMDRDTNWGREAFLIRQTIS